MRGRALIDISIRSLQSSLLTAVVFATFTGLGAWSMLTVCVGIVFVFLSVDLLIGWLRTRPVSTPAWLVWGGGLVGVKSALPIVYILHALYWPHVGGVGRLVWVISHHWPLYLGFTVLTAAATLYVVFTTRVQASQDERFEVMRRTATTRSNAREAKTDRQ